MEFQVTLPATLRAPYEARRWLNHLGMPLQFERADTAQLLMNEVITASVKHAGGCDGRDIGVVLNAENGVIRVEVTDPGLPQVPAFSDGDDVSDWTFYLVDKFADRWGVLDDGCRRLWFEMDVYKLDQAIRTAS